MRAVDWVVAGEFAVFLAALVTFVVGYTASSRNAWLRSPEGRHLVTFRSALLLLGVMGVANNLAQEYPGRDVVRIVVVGLVAVTATHGTWLMARAQLARRRALRARAAADAQRAQ